MSRLAPGTHALAIAGAGENATRRKTLTSPPILTISGAGEATISAA
jgi:hypothetical protein